MDVTVPRSEASSAATLTVASCPASIAATSLSTTLVETRRSDEIRVIAAPAGASSPTAMATAVTTPSAGALSVAPSRWRHERGEVGLRPLVRGLGVVQAHLRLPAHRRGVARPRGPSVACLSWSAADFAAPLPRRSSSRGPSCWRSRATCPAVTRSPTATFTSVTGQATEADRVAEQELVLVGRLDRAGRGDLVRDVGDRRGGREQGRCGSGRSAEPAHREDTAPPAKTSRTTMASSLRRMGPSRSSAIVRRLR